MLGNGNLTVKHKETSPSSKTHLKQKKHLQDKLRNFRLCCCRGNANIARATTITNRHHSLLSEGSEGDLGERGLNGFKKFVMINTYSPSGWVYVKCPRTTRHRNSTRPAIEGTKIRVNMRCLTVLKNPKKHYVYLASALNLQLSSLIMLLILKKNISQEWLKVCALGKGVSKVLVIELVVSIHLKTTRKSNRIISPGRGERKTYLKPSPRLLSVRSFC